MREQELVLPVEEFLANFAEIAADGEQFQAEAVAAAADELDRAVSIDQKRPEDQLEQLRRQAEDGRHGVGVVVVGVE